MGSYAYRVLRPLRPIRATVHTRTAELHVTRRDGLRMLALAELSTAPRGRTLVAFPLRDERGLPFDLVLTSLAFPVARWSDVRSRLGPGRRVLLAPGPAPAAGPAVSALESTRQALLVPLTDLPRVRRGELDVGYFRVVLTAP